MDRDLDGLLGRTHRDAVLQKHDQYLSKNSNVEVFEAGKSSSGRQQMDEGGFVSFLREKQSPLMTEEPQFRIIFIPDTPTDTDRLQLSPTALELLLDRFGICSHFAAMIHMQMQPTRKFDYEPNSRKLIRMQYLYSAVLRSMSAAENPKDQTKRLLDWRRFVAWTSRDMITGITTMVLLRCPADAQERLCGMMEDQGQYQKHLLRHPMLVHAFLAEDISFRSKTFSKAFAAPMYGLELDLGRSAAEYTQRARRFMLMARQMGNILIDYDIYLSSLKLLQNIFESTKGLGPPAGIDKDEWRDIHVEFNGSTFDDVYAEIELLKQYGQLYERRAMIGNQECTALVNQREVEISKSMSAESTVIARSAHKDGQSLRIIQYLGLVFLPLSLCTSIFGMGFFSVSFNPNDINSPIFTVSRKWWWFLALSIPFTVGVLLLAWFSAQWTVKEEEVRKRSDLTDLEKMLSYEMTEHEHSSRDDGIPP